MEILGPDRDKKFLLDPYMDWAKGEGVLIVDDFAVDMLAVETVPWARFDTRGALVHLKGRGDYVAVQLLELAPGTASAPKRHLYDEVFYVLAGHGSGVHGIERHTGTGRADGLEGGGNQYQGHFSLLDRFDGQRGRDLVPGLPWRNTSRAAG